MSVSFALVENSPYRLRYLATSEGSPIGGSASIPNDAGATPDLRTDLANDPSGPLYTIMRAGVAGIGTVAAGALTQAQARSCVNSDNTSSVGNDYVPRAIVKLIPRSGAVTWFVDVNVDGQADPIITVTASAVAGTCYIDIHARHSIDL